MSKKDRGSFPIAPSVAYELQMCACYFQSQRIQMSLSMLVICSSLLKFFKSEINTQKSIWRLSMKRGNNCNESYSFCITKTRCRAKIIPSIVSQSPDNWFGRSCRTSGRSKQPSDMVFSSHVIVGLWSSFLRPSQFSFYSSLFIHSKFSHSFHCTVLITIVLISSLWIAYAFLFSFFILSLLDLLALHYLHTIA